MKKLLLGISASLIAIPVLAGEFLDARSPQDDCEAVGSGSDTAQAQPCQVYIGAFVTTDERVTHKVIDEADKRETFADRAMRTRMLRQLRDFGPSYYAEYCVGNAVSNVASFVAGNFSQYDSLDGVAAQKVVVSAPRLRYPCVNLPA